MAIEGQIMNSAEEFAINISQNLRQMGYRKTKLLWRKQNDGVTIMFSIQKSQYDPCTWYYCFGIGIDALRKTPIKSISNCHILFRLDQREKSHLWTEGDIVALIERWERMYGDIRRLRVKAIEGHLPSQCSPEAMRYLTTLDSSII